MAFVNAATYFTLSATGDFWSVNGSNQFVRTAGLPSDGNIRLTLSGPPLTYPVSVRVNTISADAGASNEINVGSTITGFPFLIVDESTAPGVAGSITTSDHEGVDIPVGSGGPGTTGAITFVVEIDENVGIDVPSSSLSVSAYSPSVDVVVPLSSVSLSAFAPATTQFADVVQEFSASDVIDSQYTHVLAEEFSAAASFASDLFWISDYSESYDLTDAYSVLSSAFLTEAISLSGVLSSTMITTTDVSQSITLGELYTVTAIQAVSEGMELDGSFSSTLRLIAAVTEALEGADAYTGSLNVSAAVTVTAALAMALDDQFAANIAEGMTFNDTYAVALKYIAAITAAMQLADTYTNTMTVAMLVTESMELEGAIASNITIAEALQEGLSLSMAFSLGDVDYVAWVINANTGAASRYTNFPFNSFATVAGRHLACSEDGLYEITGDDDDGTDIDASILTGLMDFGSNVFKRVISCQIGYNGSGDLLLKAVVVQGGEPKEYWYQPRSQTATGVRESVAKLGKGLKSHFWQFEMINVDGADFEIDSIRWYPVALERRR